MQTSQGLPFVNELGAPSAQELPWPAWNQNPQGTHETTTSFGRDARQREEQPLFHRDRGRETPDGWQSASLRTSLSQATSTIVKYDVQSPRLGLLDLREICAR
eukprot:484077-Amphidinium_carterae.1